MGRIEAEEEEEEEGEGGSEGRWEGGKEGGRETERVGGEGKGEKEREVGIITCTMYIEASPVFTFCCYSNWWRGKRHSYARRQRGVQMTFPL